MSEERIQELERVVGELARGQRVTDKAFEASAELRRLDGLELQRRFDNLNRELGRVVSWGTDVEKTTTESSESILEGALLMTALDGKVNALKTLVSELHEASSTAISTLVVGCVQDAENLQTLDELVTVQIREVREIIERDRLNLHAINKLLDSSIDSVASNLESLRERVTSGEDSRDRMRGDLEDDIRRLESKLDDVSSEVESLKRGY